MMHLPGFKEPTEGFCSNQQYSWVTYFILSNFCNISQLVLSTHPLLNYQFCHLINLSSSYQPSVIFSSFVIYSLFTLSTHPIHAPTVHIKNTTLSPVLSCARSLCQYTFLTYQASLAIVPFWLWGDQTVAGGFLIEQTDLFYFHFLWWSSLCCRKRRGGDILTAEPKLCVLCRAGTCLFG